jgi:hypothetical protein
MTIAERYTSSPVRSIGQTLSSGIIEQAPYAGQWRVLSFDA